MKVDFVGLTSDSLTTKIPMKPLHVVILQLYEMVNQTMCMINHPGVMRSLRDCDLMENNYVCFTSDSLTTSDLIWLKAPHSDHQAILNISGFTVKQTYKCI